MQAKSRLTEDNERKTIESNMNKQPPTSGDTAQLYPHVQKIDLEGSDVDPTWVKGESISDVLNTIEKLSKVAENKEEYKKILSRMVKKTLSGNKAFDATFTGSNIDWNKTPKVIGEWDSDETKIHKTQFNERLRKNRTENWRID